MDDDFVQTEFTPLEEHQGWPGIVHGGIIATLLYEVLENYPYYNGLTAMMRGMETKFRRPGSISGKLIAKSWLVEQSGRNLKVEAHLTNEDGEVIAEGNADLVVLSEKQLERFGLA